MAYTDVGKVAATFPIWQPGVDSNAPTNDQVQVWIDEVAGDLDAVIQLRFHEQIATFATYATYLNSLTPAALNVLEKLNRWGAARELAEAFSSLGNQTAARQSVRLAQRYTEGYNQLNGQDAAGKAKSGGGDFDRLFDPLAKTPTPRAQLGGFPGAGISPDGENADFAFKKWKTPESDIDAGANTDPMEQGGEGGE